MDVDVHEDGDEDKHEAEDHVHLNVHVNVTVGVHAHVYVKADVSKYEDGNEYDAAVKFIMFRLASLSGLQSSRKTSFIETQTQNLVRLENQCNICRGFIRICLNPIRDKHNLSKL